MFLRARARHKDGKQHRYWSVVETRRVRGGRVVQRQLLHLGELNDSQHAGWVRSIEAISADSGPVRQLALFPDDYDQLPALDCEAVRIRVAQMQLRKPRQFGAPAGWRFICGTCSHSTSSSSRGCRLRASAPVGRTCSRRSSPTA